MWSHLRDRRMAGFKFRRQHPIGAFFADFVCFEAMLVVELDGGQHFDDAVVERDARRTFFLRSAGFTVLRFDNGQILRETEAVLASIRERLLSEYPHPSPLPQAVEGARQGDSP